MVPNHPTKIATSENAPHSMVDCIADVHPSLLICMNNFFFLLVSFFIAPLRYTLNFFPIKNIIQNEMAITSLDVAVEIPAPRSPNSGNPAFP